MPVFFLILVAVITLIALAIVFESPPREDHEQGAKVPPSVSLLTEPDRVPLSHEWEYKYVPIAETTLTTQDGKSWVRHREDIPLFSRAPAASPRDLRQHRIIFN